MSSADRFQARLVSAKSQHLVGMGAANHAAALFLRQFRADFARNSSVEKVALGTVGADYTFNAGLEMCTLTLIVSPFHFILEGAYKFSNPNITNNGPFSGPPASTQKESCNERNF